MPLFAEFSDAVQSLCSESADGASVCTYGITSATVVQAVLALLQFNPKSFSGANVTAPSGYSGSGR